jgi:hypothetical protein
MFDIVRFTLAADVADDGTETVGYPTGRSKGSYSGNTGKHVLVAGGNVYNSPTNFSLTFNANASDITLTNKTGRTLEAGTSCTLQLERRGPRNFDLPVVPADPDTMLEGLFYAIDLGSPLTADPNGIATAEDLGEAGEIPLDGVAATGGVATLDVPRNVTATGVTATDPVTITVTGTDAYGEVLVEEFTGPDGVATTEGKKAFKTVTKVEQDADSTDTIEIGFGDVLGLPCFLGDTGYVLGELEDGAAASAGTVVAGVADEATATTGDVRGTYEPNSACDGDAGFVLLAFIPDPSDKGVAQFAG